MTDSVKDADFAPEMVLVPPGKFSMGSDIDEGELNEQPRHQVVIDYPLLVGKHPVTFEEWDYFYHSTPSGKFNTVNRELLYDATWFEGEIYPNDEGWGRDRSPVINVSWYDAVGYANWLSKVTGNSYRLLSEAEWEYACRARTETSFAFGDTISPSQANFDYANYEDEHDTYQPRTTEVGTFPANNFGLHDMHGNVSEWCEDAWTENYKCASSDGSAHSTAIAAEARVIRGGSWDKRCSHMRSAKRSWTYPENRFFDLGFRLARELEC